MAHSLKIMQMEGLPVERLMGKRRKIRKRRPVSCSSHGRQKNRSVAVAAQGRIEFSRCQNVDDAIAPGDQHFAVGEQGGRVAATSLTHGAGLRPGTRTGVVEFGPRQGGADIVNAPGDQHLAVGEQGGTGRYEPYSWSRSLTRYPHRGRRVRPTPGW